MSGGQSRTVFLVARPSAADKQGIVDLGGSGPQASFVITPEYGVRVSAGQRVWSVSASTTRPQVLSIVMTGGGTDTLSAWLNGLSMSASKTVAVALTTGGGGSVGTWTRQPVATGNNFVGEIGEIIVYNRVLTTAERNKIESYLAQKYGVTLGSF